MKSENKIVPDTKKTVTISIEEYEALQELKAENARLNQQIQWLEGIRLSRKKAVWSIVGEKLRRRTAQLPVQRSGGL